MAAIMRVPSDGLAVGIHWRMRRCRRRYCGAQAPGTHQERRGYWDTPQSRKWPELSYMGFSHVAPPYWMRSQQSMGQTQRS
jgi:hypothetical protein